jgi:hypothetical protein
MDPRVSLFTVKLERICIFGQDWVGQGGGSGFEAAADAGIGEKVGVNITICSPRRLGTWPRRAGNSIGKRPVPQLKAGSDGVSLSVEGASDTAPQICRERKKKV